MEWNREILKAYIKKYKENLPQIRADEAYKWKAVRHFQDHWDIEAEKDPEAVREMFRCLYDETRPVEYFAGAFS